MKQNNSAKSAEFADPMIIAEHAFTICQAVASGGAHKKMPPAHSRRRHKFSS
ncbi:hypothetical protein [Symmachiella dynata]|uniref:hypothetical protein n=1 Tax=Symmachiella dynata TaxID=2527995 RepID=UPI0018D4C6D0|nr:hypothetical protein [Symmachiella dynata]